MFIPLENNDLTGTLNRFFQDLLEKKLVDGLIVPQAIFDGKSYAHTLVRDPSKITAAAPFLPVMMNSGASVVSSLTFTGAEQKLGAVLRACEIRAVTELAKFKQVDLDKLMIIAVDCAGTVEPDEFQKLIEGNGSFSREAFLSEAASGKPDNVRQACRVCPYPVWQGADVNLGFLGGDPSRELFLSASPEISEKLGLEGDGGSDKREKLVSSLIEEKKKRREALLEGSKERFKSVSAMMEEFARCKRCYNCRTECPICYCKECVFLTDIFEHMPKEYLRWADRKGLIRMPYDTLLFHLTRLNHMGTSCIECGQCSSACPSGLPVFELFQLIGKRVQDLFEYVPGMNPEDESPLVTFREKELQPL